MARPKKITKEVLGKLESAFKLGSNDREACYYAGITGASFENKVLTYN